MIRDNFIHGSDSKVISFGILCDGPWHSSLEALRVVKGLIGTAATVTWKSKDEGDCSSFFDLQRGYGTLRWSALGAFVLFYILLLWTYSDTLALNKVHFLWP